MNRRVMFVSLALLAVMVSPARAQQPPRQYVAINPVAAVFEALTIDYERALTQRLSAGVTSMYFGPAGEDFSWTSVDAKLRFYPGDQVLDGFSIGAMLGYANVAPTSWVDDLGERHRSGALSTGVSLDYNWFLGGGNRFMVGTGLGAKRLWVLDSDIGDDRSVAYPIMRLSVGVAF